MTEPAPEFVLDNCRSCNAQIVWAVAEQSLRSLPVDPQPVKNGNIRLIRRDGKAPLARSLTVEQRSRSGGPLYQAHFASCPYADKHRRAGRGRGGGR
jgi:hypothetical protein